ncbi:sugar transferase [Candidatus Peribacteria bacterium]|nr:sugar transferase [Candidatus Peribacteria bacterium]
MKRSEVFFGLLRIPMDMLAIAAALLASYRLREARIDLIPNVQLLTEAQTLPSFEAFVRTFAISSAVVLLILIALLGLYALRATLSAWQEAGRMVIAVFVWLVGVMAWFFLVERELFYSRMLLAHATVFLIVFLWMGRVAILLFQRALMRHGVGVRMVISVGAQPPSHVAQETLMHDWHYEYIGHVPDFTALKRMIPRCRPDLVLQTDPNPQSKDTVTLIDYCRSRHIGYAFLPPVFADVPHQLQVERLGLVPVLRFQPTPLDGWGKVWKRLFDMVASAALLSVLLPVFLLIAIVILLTSGWPIFYVSRRVGERADGLVPVIKFRSMIRDAEERKMELLGENERKDGPLFKLTNDPRITPVGRVLHRFDLDELPQLFNVLLGHMSLVGPRPHLPEEVDRYSPYERRVFAVKPGMTGLAQVSGRSMLKFREEVQLDLRYVEEWSLLFDLWIMWRTIWVVLSGRHARN